MGVFTTVARLAPHMGANASCDDEISAVVADIAAVLRE